MHKHPLCNMLQACVGFDKRCNHAHFVVLHGDCHTICNCSTLTQQNQTQIRDRQFKLHIQHPTTGHVYHLTLDADSGMQTQRCSHEAAASRDAELGTEKTAYFVRHCTAMLSAVEVLVSPDIKQAQGSYNSHYGKDDAQNVE